MDFVTLESSDFDYGVGEEIIPGVTRVIAENPSKFTYQGTGTYIIGGKDVAVIDPGPMLDTHRDALAAALTGRTVRAILVTHCHSDHSPLAAWLRAETGAPTYAYGPHGGETRAWDIGALPDDFGRAEAVADDGGDPDATTGPTEPKVEESTDVDFEPVIEVRSGDAVFSDGPLTITAVHTPGHTSNHMCFAMTSPSAGRVLFTGDHVMGWSTTVVSPPDGDMADYMNSLRMVSGRRDDIAVPTHGSPIHNPGLFVGQLVDHRLDRERQVLDAVRRGRRTIPEMVTELYADVRVELHRPAGASVLGHLVKLVSDGLVVVDGGTTGPDRPRLDATYRPV